MVALDAKMEENDVELQDLGDASKINKYLLPGYNIPDDEH